MTIWTAMPLELVFEGYNSTATPESNQIEINYKGRSVLIEPLAFNRGKVVRLISTDPFDYLLEEFQPGALINLG